MFDFKLWQWRNGIGALGLGAVLSGCMALPADEQNKLPYRLSVTSHFQLPSPLSYKFADLDGIESAEIISISTLGPKYTLQFYRQPNAPPITKFEFDGRLIPDSTPLDIDHDGVKEYFVCEQTDGGTILYAVWPFAENRLQKIYSAKSPADSTAGNNLSIHVRDLIDVNEDGQDELILYVTANRGQSTNLMALNWKTGKRVWNLKLTGSITDYINISRFDKLTASRIDQFTASRIDQFTASRIDQFTASRIDQFTARGDDKLTAGGDGKFMVPRDGERDDVRPLEILLTTEGGDSKLRVAGAGKTALDDKHSYLVSVNGKNGECEYAQAFGPSFTKIALYSPDDLNLPASRDRFLLVISLPDRRGIFEIWDAQTRRSVAQMPIAELKWHFIADVNRDRVRDIVFMNGANDWQAVEANLQPLANFPKTLSFPPFVTVPALPDIQPPMPIHLPRVGELTSSRSSGEQTGIVAQLANRAGFMVFDDQLQPLAIWDEGLSGEFSVRPRGPNDDLFWSTPEHAYFFRLEPAARFDFARLSWATLFVLGLAAALYLGYLQIQRQDRQIIERFLQGMQGHEIGACVLESSGRIVQINQQGKKILGLGDHDLSKQQIHDVLADNQYVELCNLLNNGVHNGAFVPQSCTLYQAHAEKEIEVLKVSLDAMLKRNRMEVLLLRDLTAHYAAQKTTFWAKTAQKLVHNLKTPLSNILMSIDHLSREYNLQPSANGNGQVKENYIERIRSEVARMSKQTIGFVKFAELEKPKFEPLAANDLLLAAAARFEPMFGERIQLARELDEKLPLIMADAKQMRIALSNLLDNAIAAMSEGGVLTLRTYPVSSLPDSEGNAPQYVAMEIQDTGSGITPEILQSINEQKVFVTTKLDGTGVGLVQVQQIIADHRGQFEIKSTPGVGTVVYLAVPV